MFHTPESQQQVAILAYLYFREFAIFKNLKVHATCHFLYFVTCLQMACSKIFPYATSNCRQQTWPWLRCAELQGRHWSKAIGNLCAPASGMHLCLDMPVRLLLEVPATGSSFLSKTIGMSPALHPGSKLLAIPILCSLKRCRVVFFIPQGVLSWWVRYMWYWSQTGSFCKGKHLQKSFFIYKVRGNFMNAGCWES